LRLSAVGTFRMGLQILTGAGVRACSPCRETPGVYIPGHH
jgi:hypothetical protein